MKLGKLKGYCATFTENPQNRSTSHMSHFHNDLMRISWSEDGHMKKLSCLSWDLNCHKGAYIYIIWPIMLWQPLIIIVLIKIIAALAAINNNSKHYFFSYSLASHFNSVWNIIFWQTLIYYWHVVTLSRLNNVEASFLYYVQNVCIILSKFYILNQYIYKF